MSLSMNIVSLTRCYVEPANESVPPSHLNSNKHSLERDVDITRKQPTKYNEI